MSVVCEMTDIELKDVAIPPQSKIKQANGANPHFHTILNTIVLLALLIWLGVVSTLNGEVDTIDSIVQTQESSIADLAVEAAELADDAVLLSETGPQVMSGDLTVRNLITDGNSYKSTLFFICNNVSLVLVVSRYQVPLMASTFRLMPTPSQSTLLTLPPWRVELWPPMLLTSPPWRVERWPPTPKLSPPWRVELWPTTPRLSPT